MFRFITRNIAPTPSVAHRRDPAVLAAADPLDADDVGAEVGQERRTVRPGDVATEVENPGARENAAQRFVTLAHRTWPPLYAWQGEMVEAVGIEPTSGNPQPQASTSIAGLSYDSLALRSSIRQEGREASLIFLAHPLRPSSEPATRI